MSGECQKCQEHCLDCKCGIQYLGCDPKDTKIGLHKCSLTFPKFIPIPEYSPSFEEISKQMRINADILIQEITAHVDSQILRIKCEMEKYEYCQKCKNEWVSCVCMEHDNE